MHKIDTPTAHNGSFVDPVPQQGTAGTVVDSSWLNAVQNEICNAIVLAGITLQKSSNTQLFEASQKLIDDTCKKSVFSGLTLNDSVGTTPKSIGNLVEILYAEADWFASASIFVKIITPDSGAVLTVSFVFKEINDTEHVVFSKQIDASEAVNMTIPMDVSVPYTSGSVYFKVVSTATVDVEIVVQGYTTKI